MLSDTRLKDGRQLIIAHAAPADAAEIVAYVERASAETDFLTFGAGEFGITVADEEKFIASLEGGAAGFMLVGKTDGAVVSTCTVMRPKRPRVQHLGVFGISVARATWGLGVGQAMCLAALAAARDIDVTKLSLEVREDNATAIRLYEKVGFRVEGRAERALKVGGKYYANVMMGLCLD